MLGSPNKIVTKHETESDAELAEALGPGFASVTIQEGSAPRLFLPDRTPLRFFEGVVPIIKPLGGRFEVVGTGFWLHKYGVLGTARHVLADLWDETAGALRPAFALHCRLDAETDALSCYLRMIRHAVVPVNPEAADVAVALVDHLTDGSSEPLANNYFAYTEEHPALGETLYSYGYPRNPTIDKPDQTINGTLVEGPYVAYLKPGEFMYAYPTFRAEMKIDHAASGSPVFDAQGRVCAVASSGISDDPAEGAQKPISHLLPMGGFLDLELTELTGTPTTLREILANR